MTSYLVTNIAIFLSCLLTAWLLKNAPARPKFYLYVISLASWLVPWPTIYSGLKTSIINDSFQTSRLASIDMYSLDYILVSIEYYIQNHAFLTMLVMTIVGVLWFLLDVLKSQHFHLSRLKNSTKFKNNLKLSYDNPKNIEIRVGNFSSPGAITGILTPIIWLDSSLDCANKLKLVLLHELKHIQQNDHLWMWSLAFVQRIFWWNPIVTYCIRQSKLELELSCDEKCEHELPEKIYALGLANILMNHTKNQKQQELTLLNIKHSNKLNVRRIERLMVNYRFKSWHLAACFISLFLCLSSVFTIAIASPVDQAQNHLLKITAENNHKRNCPNASNRLKALNIS